jgi:hypothetical protein
MVEQCVSKQPHGSEPQPGLRAERGVETVDLPSGRRLARNRANRIGAWGVLVNLTARVVQLASSPSAGRNLNELLLPEPKQR